MGFLTTFAAGGGFSGAFDVGTAFGLAAYGNSKAKKAAKSDRSWQEFMSNTAYQRKVEDLKKAGLNPMLAIGGGGASTPSGSTAKTYVPDSKPVTTSLAKQRLNQELKNMQAQEAQAISTAAKNRSGVTLDMAAANRQNADATTAREQAAYLKTQNTNAQYLTPGLMNEAAIEAGDMGKIYRHGKHVSQILGGFAGAAAGFGLGRAGKKGRGKPKPRDGRPTRRPGNSGKRNAQTLRSYKP